MSLESSHCPGCWCGHPVPLSSAGPSQRCCGDATTACSLPCCEREAGEATLLRTSHLHQHPLTPGSQRDPSQPWHGAQTCLTWGTRHWGARLWSQGPAGPVCPHCPPSWQPLRGPAVNMAPLRPAPEGHTQSLCTYRSPCPAPCIHGCPHPGQAWWPCWIAKAAGPQGGWAAPPADPNPLSTLTGLQPNLLFPPALLPGWWAPPGTPESKVGPPHPVAWTHHCRDLHAWLLLWSQRSWLPLVCLALGDKERGQSRMECPEWGGCQ